jgi:uroporphyrinogen-III synthase
VANLGGRTIAFLEGRRTAEMADLIARHNGVPLAAPCLREVHSPEAPSLQAEVRLVLAADVDAAIFLTGVGTATIFECARALRADAQLHQRLEAATVVVRGPKPTAVLRKLGVRIDLTAPVPNTTREVAQVLEPLDLHGKHVAVQHYGEPNPTLTTWLQQRGAQLIELHPYLWDRPVDPAPIHALLDALQTNSVDMLLVTSQAQVENLFAIANERGEPPRLDNVAIGAQGPVAQAALERHGARASFTPAHGHMGALVLAAADYVTQREGVPLS